MQNTFHSSFISRIHAMLAGLLWCLLHMHSRDYLLFLHNCTLFCFCIWHQLYLREMFSQQRQKWNATAKSYSPLVDSLNSLKRWRDFRGLSDLEYWEIPQEHVLNHYFLPDITAGLPSLNGYFHIMFLPGQRWYVMVHMRSQTVLRRTRHSLCFLPWELFSWWLGSSILLSLCRETEFQGCSRAAPDFQSGDCTGDTSACSFAWSHAPTTDRKFLTLTRISE